jgi:hypothetical protein
MGLCCDGLSTGWFEKDSGLPAESDEYRGYCREGEVLCGVVVFKCLSCRDYLGSCREKAAQVL